MTRSWLHFVLPTQPVPQRLCVFSIFMVAVAIRFACLGTNPDGVFPDEAEKGYSSWSVARVGGVFDFLAPRDLSREPEVGVPYIERWPLFINVWGSLTSMTYQYAALPFVGPWGPSAWTVRLPAAFAGSLTVLLSFFLARRLTGRLDAALWTMTLMALSPWHVVFSRWAQQGIFVPLFMTGAILAFLRGQSIPKHRIHYTVLSAIGFGLAFYTYSGAQPFLLVFWVMMMWVFRRDLAREWKTTLAGAILLTLLLAPTLYATLRGGGSGMGRFTALSVWNLNESFGRRAFLFLKNYLVHFSPQFLFLTGDAQDRHSVRGFGEMFHVEMPFLIAGLYVAARRGTAFDRLLIGWFLIFPFSAALTNEGIPHALRSLHAVPCPQILSAMGIVEVLGWIRRKWGSAARRVVVGLVAFDAIAFLVALFVFYPYYSGPYFGCGIRESLATAEKAATDIGAIDSRIYVPYDGGAPGFLELYFFYLETPPETLLREGLATAPVWIVHGAPDLSHLGRLMRPGDSLLVNASVFARGGIYEGMSLPETVEEHTVFWTTRPFSKEKIPNYIVISRKAD